MEFEPGEYVAVKGRSVGRVIRVIDLADDGRVRFRYKHLGAWRTNLMSRSLFDSYYRKREVN